MWNVHCTQMSNFFRLSTLKWLCVMCTVSVYILYIQPELLGFFWTNENLILCKFTFRLKRVFENTRSDKIVSDWLHIGFSVRIPDQGTYLHIAFGIQKKKTLFTKYMQWKLQVKSNEKVNGQRNKKKYENIGKRRNSGVGFQEVHFGSW